MSYHQMMIIPISVLGDRKGSVLTTKLKIHQFHQNQRSVLRKRRKRFILAVMKDVQIKLSREECVLGTVLRERGRRHAVKRDVPIR